MTKSYTSFVLGLLELSVLAYVLFFNQNLSLGTVFSVVLFLPLLSLGIFYLAWKSWHAEQQSRWSKILLIMGVIFGCIPLLLFLRILTHGIGLPGGL